MKTNNKIRLLLLFFLVINYSKSYSTCDICNPTCIDYVGPCDPPPPAPIDGGASLLVGAGIAYGMKKIRDKKKSRKDLKDTI